MKIAFEHHGNSFQCDLSKGRSLARELRFVTQRSEEERFIPESLRAPFQSGGFVGAIESQGSCNVDRLDLIPHCHGTHTETALHIINYRWSDLDSNQQSRVPLIIDVSPVGLMTAHLVTLEPMLASDSSDTYHPNFNKEDRILTGEAIEKALKDCSKSDALIVRTDKQRYDFNSGPSVPYFSIEAMNAIVEFGCKHLLVDMPSVDRLQDDGHLTCHHLYWNIPEHEHTPTMDSQLDKTITEMIDVATDIKDGFYLLNLQTGPYCTDASPSRPILYAVDR